MSGFEFRETMAGSYHLLSAPEDERPMSFTIRARARGILSFLRRPEVEIEGEVDAEGFADRERAGEVALGVPVHAERRQAVRIFGEEDALGARFGPIDDGAPGEPGRRGRGGDRARAPPV